MDEKTEELRDIFLDVAEEDTVTESQQEGRGSLTADETAVDSRLQEVIEQIRETFTLSTAFTDEELCEVVRRFYAGEDDTAIATALDREPAAVFRARMDLLLIHETDRPDDGLDAAVREHLDADERIDVIAEAGDVDEETARRAVTVVEAANRSRRVSHRFRTAFEEILTDTDLSVQFTADTHEDGLDDATEGAEVDVEF
jgi:hypothetical protein